MGLSRPVSPVYEDDAGGSVFVVAGLVWALYVPPGERGKGRGRALMERVLRDADEGGTRLELEARAYEVSDEPEMIVPGPFTDDLAEWYRRLGFEGDSRNRLVRKARRLEGTR